MKRALLAALCAILLTPAAAQAGVLGKTPNALGMTGYWPLNDESGSVADDYSGNGKHGTLTGTTLPSWVDGKFGKGLQFGVANNYVSTTVSWPSSGSISVWAYPTSIGDWRSPAGWKSGVTSTYGYVLLDMGNASRWRAVFRPNLGGNSEATVTALSTLRVNRWHHLVMTWSLVSTTYTINFYVNGVHQGQTTWTGTPGSSGLGNFNFGKSGDYADNYFVGREDDVRTFNRALSAAEVASLYADGPSTIVSGRVLQRGTTLGNGLVGYWSFDGADFSTTIADRSGNANNGYLYNGATSSAKVSGKLGQALRLDGTDDHVRVAHATALNPDTSDFAISAWVKSSNMKSGDAIALKTNGGAAHGAYGFHYGVFGTRQPTMHFSSGAAFTQIQSASSLESGEWNHVVITVDRDTMANTKIYINGEVTTTNVTNPTSNTGSLSNSVPFAIGAESDGESPWDGQIDEVRYYLRTLSAAEAKQLYQMGAGKLNASSKTLERGSSFTHGLAGHWTFDGADFTTTVADKSGAGYHGYVFGSATSSVKTAGRLGQGLVLDGSSGYIRMSGTDVSAPCTMSAWVRLSSRNALGSPILSSNSGSWTGFRAEQNSSDAVGITVSGVADYVFSSPGYTIPLHTWTHVTAVVSSASAATLYIDGVSSGSISGASSLACYRGFIGSNVSLNDKLPGALDDARVYSRALSAAEVKQLYLMGK